MLSRLRGGSAVELIFFDVKTTPAASSRGDKIIIPVYAS